MRRGLIALGIAAVAAFVGALMMLEAHEDPAGVGAEATTSAADVPERTATQLRETPPSPRRAPEHPPSLPPGFKLGKGSGPHARSNAQAILDDTLVELRRLDTSQQELARDIYMRGHSAAERVEDELSEDDEPGRAELRAHEDALKAELRRIYGVDEPTPRP